MASRRILFRAGAPSGPYGQYGTGLGRRTLRAYSVQPRESREPKPKLPKLKVRQVTDPSYDPRANYKVPEHLEDKSLSELGGTAVWKIKLLYGFMKFFGMDIEENQAAPVAGGTYMRECKIQAYHAPGTPGYSSYAKFYYEDLGLPATLSQHFQITALHAWMLLVRMRALSPKYAAVNEQALIDGIFLDLENRIVDEYNIRSGRLINNTLKEYNLQLRGSIYAYDEGLISNDAVLAAAIWRNVFNGAKDINLEHLATMVRHVHTNLYVLDKMSDFDFAVGSFKFLSPWIEYDPKTVMSYQPPPLPSTKIFPDYVSKYARDD